MMRLRQRGDSIVEVLIAMAVVSSVLAGAFVSSNRSLLGTRKSEERVQGAKVAESQMERLRQVAADPLLATQVFTGSPDFCLTDTNSIGSGCTTTPPGAGAEFRYGIKRVGTNTFVAYARWDRIGGGGEEEASVAYKVYKND